MSRPIKITTDLLEDARAEFEKQLQTMKMFDGKISFSKTYKWKEDDKATIIFNPTAYIKMFQLIQEFDSEVAWHGVARRDEVNEALFYIDDILVYPQTVTGATVTTDQEKYQSWLMGLEDDIFNNVRMQGHSHVNMQPSPSGVDTTHQEAILNQLDDTMFYIFMIWNKSLKHNIKIFDLKNNTLYEDSDINVSITWGADGYSFIDEAKELVVKTTYSSGYTQNKNKTTNIGSYKNGNNSKLSEEKAGNGYRNRGMSCLDDDYGNYGNHGYHGYGYGYNY